MIAGLDSSFSRPSPVIATQARAAGIGLWSGYLATKGGVNLASPWDLASFDVARQVGGKPIAFCSGWDDPVACRNLAAQWNVRLCLDVEAGIRDDGAWVDGFLATSGAGLYGRNSPLGSIHYHMAPFHIGSYYPGQDPGKTWYGPLPSDGTPLGWQWQGDHQEFGLSVDRGWYDDWFAGEDMTPEQDGLLRATFNLLAYGATGDPYNVASALSTAAKLDALSTQVANLQVPPANLKPVLDAIAALKGELDTVKAKTDKDLA